MEGSTTPATPALAGRASEEGGSVHSLPHPGAPPLPQHATQPRGPITALASLIAPLFGPPLPDSVVKAAPQHSDEPLHVRRGTGGESRGTHPEALLYPFPAAAAPSEGSDAAPARLPPATSRLRRSRSFAGLTAREAAAMEDKRQHVALKKFALALAREESDHIERATRFAALILFEVVLTLSYICYRVVACDGLHWQCSKKDMTSHFDNASSLIMIGGVLFATGPTVTDSSFLLPCLTSFFSSIFTFGALGELPALQNSLNSADAWRPPAVFVYASAFIILLGSIAYVLSITRSRYELAVSGLTLFLIVLSITIFPILKAAGAYSGVFHLHHYQTAAYVCLLIRDRSDRPSVLARWTLMGVTVQGIAAYSAGSMLSS